MGNDAIRRTDKNEFMAWKGAILKPVCKREHETVDHLIKRFRRKVTKDGILDAYRQKSCNVTPSEKRRNKHAAHLRKMKKDSRRMRQF